MASIAVSFLSSNQGKLIKIVELLMTGAMALLLLLDLMLIMVLLGIIINFFE